MEKEKKEDFFQRSATGLEMKLGDWNWKNRKDNGDFLLDFMAGVVSRERVAWVLATE